MQQASHRWVLINVLCEYTGYSDDAVRAKMQRGKWVTGAHWRKAPDGRIVFNLTRIQQWMSGDVPQV